MNRTVVISLQSAHRGIHSGSADYKRQVDAWTQRILAREPVAPDGYRFSWARGDHSVTNTAHLFDAVMCNVQYAQQQLHRSQTMVGRQAYKTALDAAKTYAFVLQHVLPKWTFQPVECYTLPDALPHDIYGHYCLSRAVAYSNVGKADLEASDKAQLVAGSNAAHLFMVAAHLIDGDTTSMVNRAQQCTADVLCRWAETYLDAWQTDQDNAGAAKALACYQEAHARYTSAGHRGCQERVEYAHNRNSVYWIQPELPDWNQLLRPRVTAL